MDPEIPKLDVDDATSTSDLLYVSELVSDLDPAQVEMRQKIATALDKREHPTSMIRTFGWIARTIAKLLFAHVLFESSAIKAVRDKSQDSTVVYVMQSRSLLDYLYFNWACITHDLPLARFSNGTTVRLFAGIWRYWLGFFRRRPPGQDEDVFHALIEHGHSAFLFLDRPTFKSSENEAFSQKFLFRMVRCQRESHQPIVVVPLILVWERRPNEKHATIVEEVFGSAQSPGFFRKFFYWFRTIWQSFLRFGQPVARVSETIDLATLLAELPEASTADASELLRNKLVQRIESERRVILGPTSEAPKTLWNDITTQPALMRVIADVAKEEGVPEETIVQRAEEDFKEIAAEPNLMTMKILSAFLSLIWYRIYDGFEVDDEGLQKVRDAGRESSIVLIPSHKSHIDYLVISYLFYHYGMNNPLIAAGANLNFWPLGPIFRRGGAFFIRRSFKGDDVYKTVFREYLTSILQHRYPVEFFIEGTRSRTGKLVKPKYGMLDMIVSAYATGRIDSVKLVPIAVNYERVIESKSHRDEQLGGEKEKESLTGLLRTPQFLTRKYGRTYVEFNEPIDLGEYLEKYGFEPGFSLAESSEVPDDFGELIVRLAHRIIYDINEVTTLTPTALAATVLLSNDAKGVGRARFLADVGFVLRFLTEPERDVRISRTLRESMSTRLRGSPLNDERSSTSGERNPVLESLLGRAAGDVMDWALQVFEQSDQLKIKHDKDGEDTYIVPTNARLELAYYRNTIVHHFVPEALLSTAIRSFVEREFTLDVLMERTLFLSRLFKYEWIYEERAEFENVFMRSLNYFKSSSWIRVTDNEEQMVRIGDPVPDEILFFRRQVLNFLEGYRIVADHLHDLEDEPVEMNEFVATVLKRAKKDAAQGNVMFHESLSKPTYQNALRLFADWGILTRTTNEKGKSYFQLSQTSLIPLEELLQRLKQYVFPERFDAPSDDE